MQPDDLLRRLAVALAIGLLVGAERHWRDRDAQPGTRTAGVRTFGLTGLTGGVVAALGETAGPLGGALLLAAGLFALVAVLLPFALREAEAESRFSATGLVAAIATYALGALAVSGAIQAAGAAAVAMTALLAARESLHGLVARITWAELRSAVLLLSMTLVALPLVPDEPIDWLLGVNPARVWTLAVLLAAVSWLGYLAVKLGGERTGLLIAGAAAGLVSSTAVTLGNAAAARRGGPAGGLAAGALVAGSVSCLRTLGLAMLTAPGTGWRLLPALLAATIVLAAAAFLLGRNASPGDESTELGDPFEIRSVLRMALLLGAVGAAAKLGAERLGTGAVLGIALVTGLTDVDAITLSVPPLAPEQIALELASQAVGVAVASNLVAKSLYAAALGGRGFAVRFGLGSAAGLAAGAAGFALA